MSVLEIVLYVIISLATLAYVIVTILKWKHPEKFKKKNKKAKEQQEEQEEE